MLPCAIRRRSASGEMSTSSIWSAARTTSSGTVSRCGTPVIALDDVVERLEVLDVDGGDHVDAGGEQLVDVLPALLVARCRATLVWASSSTSATSGRAREHGVEVELRRTSCPRYVQLRRGTTSSPLEPLGGVGAAVRLDDADDDVGAARQPPPALVEHGVRLAHPGRRAEVDPQPPRPAHRRSSLPRWPSARLSSQDVRPAARRGSRGSGPRCASSTSAGPAATSARVPGDPATCRSA